MSGTAVALAILPKVAATLSILGSCCIIMFTMCQTSKNRRVYHRLVFCMSVSDLMYSFAVFLSTWPMPPESGAWGAVGNKSTCIAQGFFVQLGLLVPMYNACLAVNYLLVIKYEWSESRVQRVEPWMHFLTISLCTGFAISSVPLDLYNPANLWCWISAFDGRGKGAYYFQWGFFYIPLWTIVAFVSYAMFQVYRKVRSHEDNINVCGTLSNNKKMRKHRKSQKVATQAFLYIGAFYVTWIFGTVNRLIITIDHEIVITPLLILQSFFTPLQGFLNFLVYVRPRYSNYKSLNRNFTCPLAVKAILPCWSYSHSSNSLEETTDEAEKSGPTDKSGPTVEVGQMRPIQQTQQGESFGFANQDPKNAYQSEDPNIAPVAPRADSLPTVVDEDSVKIE
uniref:G-protein coupled receptors family 2 profile 2 domain-containing protein n=2 Tax=Mucochytrium quahogii TaxID=96639 RepID=A0A7S2RHZ5_9STRA|mmetsp:Transcript_10751/g.17619  ORF Transcript_10751/g.17619 Transcript_10751/m.17619 type:complete len:394 (+) Transcript_10751:310-1491(+)